MRTNIVIDDRLMRQARAATGLPTKRAVVTAGLELLVAAQREQRIRRLRGRVGWNGDLDAMRGAPEPGA